MATENMAETDERKRLDTTLFNATENKLASDIPNVCTAAEITALQSRIWGRLCACVAALIGKSYRRTVLF